MWQPILVFKKGCDVWSFEGYGTAHSTCSSCLVQSNLNTQLKACFCLQCTTGILLAGLGIPYFSWPYSYLYYVCVSFDYKKSWIANFKIYNLASNASYNLHNTFTTRTELHHLLNYKKKDHFTLCRVFFLLINKIIGRLTDNGNNR